MWALRPRSSRKCTTKPASACSQAIGRSSDSSALTPPWWPQTGSRSRRHGFLACLFDPTIRRTPHETPRLQVPQGSHNLSGSESSRAYQRSHRRRLTQRHGIKHAGFSCGETVVNTCGLMIDGCSNAERIQKREHVVGAGHQFGSVLANEGVTASRTHRGDRAGNSEYRARTFGRLGIPHYPSSRKT